MDLLVVAAIEAEAAYVPAELPLLGGRGLSELARAHRENRPVSEELQLQTVSFQSGAEHERHVLPGFAHPATPALFAPVWQPLAQALRGHSDSGRGVIVDAGRIGGTGLPSALLGASDLVLVCVRSSLRSLAALRLHLPTLQHQLDESSRAELGLLVVGPGRPYSSSEISRQFSVPVVHELAWEPRQAEVYSDGATPGRSWGGGQLNRSLRAAASALDERVRRREEVVRCAGHQRVGVVMSRPEVAQAVADLGRTLDSLAAAQPGWSGAVAVAPDAPGRSRASAASPAVDWSLVVVLRRRASEEITAASQRWGGEHGAAMDREDRRMMGRSVIRQVVRHHAEELARRGQALWSLEQEQACAAAVENAIFGYGRLQPLFEIPTAENIEIHGWDSVVVQFGDGRREEHPPVADSDEELVEAIRFLGESASPSRPFDDAHPMMTLGVSANLLPRGAGSS